MRSLEFGLREKVTAVTYWESAKAGARLSAELKSSKIGRIRGRDQDRLRSRTTNDLGVHITKHNSYVCLFIIQIIYSIVIS